jgi:hypothetical protein
MTTKAHEFRAPDVAPGGRRWKELYRYNNGDPIEVKPGESPPDIAFGGKDAEGWPYAIGYATRSESSDNPNNKAHDFMMRWTCDLYHVCNGRRVNKNGEYVLY